MILNIKCLCMLVMYHPSLHSSILCTERGKMVKGGRGSKEHNNLVQRRKDSATGQDK